MGKLTILFCSLITVLSVNAQRNIHFLNEEKIERPSYTLNQNTNEIISFTVEINSYELIETKTEEGHSYIVHGAESSQILEKGAPDLSKLAQSIIIPDNGKFNLTTKGIEFIEIGNIEITPSKGNISRDISPSSISYEWGDAYNANEFYPGNLAKLNDSYVFRDFRGQTVWMYPYQYNPAKKVLRIYTKLEVTLTNTYEPGKNQKVRKSGLSISKPFKGLYQKQFLNYNKHLKYTPINEGGNMLIISHPSYVDAMQEFVLWKQQMGIHVEMVSSNEIGVSSTTIYNYINNYYQEKGLTYLLLVGDAEHITPMYKSGDSDAAYGHLEGNDSYAEVFVGRFSAQSDLDLAVQIQRSIYYERDMNESADWLNKATGIASNEGGAGIGDDDETDKLHMNNLRTDLLNYGYSSVDQIYDPGANYTAVKAAIEEGRGLINYVGHGSNTEWVTSSFSISRINELENEYKYPFIFDVACVNGNFNGNTCFAEAFIRARKDTIPTGAVAIIASTINQDWAPPMDAQDEMVDILTGLYADNIKQTFGGIAINGCMHMNDHYGTTGSNMTNTWTIFGDPSLMVRTKIPEPMVVSHSNVIITGMSGFKVECNVEGASVSLANGDSIIGTAFVSNGNVIFDVSSIENDFTATLTITAFNKVTYIDEIEVVTAQGPYLVINEIAINDENENNNGNIDYGEVAKLQFDIKNVGLTEATNLEATLIDHSGYFELSEDCIDQVIDNISSSEISEISQSFTIELSDTVPDQINLQLELQIESLSSEETWNRVFYVNANAPNFEIGDYTFVEVNGDNNGRIDPGEEILIQIPLKNSGHSEAKDITSLIDFNSPYITIGAFDNEVGMLETGDSAIIQTPVVISENAPLGTEVSLSVEINSGRNYNGNQMVTLGSVPVANLGDGEEVSSKYPFYNYYSSNRTQIIYSFDELGAGEKTLNAMSLILNRFPSNPDKRALKDFKIKALHIQDVAHSGGFVNTSSAETLLEGDYELPGETGEVIFELNPFVYNGTDNLLIDISWGANDYFAGSDSFTVLSSQTNVNSVAYGYQDNTSNPSFIGVSNIRPNTIFYFEQKNINIYNVGFLVINSGYNYIHDNALVKIGSYEVITNEEGKAFMQLAEGRYEVVTDAGYNVDVTTGFSLIEDNQQVIIDMIATGITETKKPICIFPNPVYNTLFIDFETVPDAVKIFNMYGQLILEFNGTDLLAPLDIGEIEKGAYIIQISSKNIEYATKLIKN